MTEKKDNKCKVSTLGGCCCQGWCYTYLGMLTPPPFTLINSAVLPREFQLTTQLPCREWSSVKIAVAQSKLSTRCPDRPAVSCY